MHQKKTRFIFGLVTVIFLMLFLSGCKSAELKAMEDATSVLQLTKGQEVERYITDKHRGFTGPVYPEVLIVYEPLNNYTQEEIYAEIVEILENNNWVGSEPNTGQKYFKASLQQGNFEISTGVSIDSRNNHVVVKMIIYP